MGRVRIIIVMDGGVITNILTLIDSATMDAYFQLDISSDEP